MKANTIRFRRLAKSDLTLLYKWLNLPHMRMYYQKQPISLAETHTKYLPRLTSLHPTHCHIATIDSRPVGKFQSYRIYDYKDLATEIGIEEGVSVDWFIGEENYLGRGLGKRLLHTYVTNIVRKTFPGE